MNTLPNHLLLRGLPILALPLLWQTLPTPLLPKPDAIFQAWIGLWQAGLAYELWQSLLTNLQAIAATAVIGLLFMGLASIPALRPWVRLVGQLRFLGMAGLTLLFTLLLDNGQQLKIAMMVFGMSVFLITALAADIATIPVANQQLARSLGLGRWAVFREVVLLGRLGHALDLLRQNAAMGWMMLTMVEGLVRGDGGIGALLLTQNKHFHLPEVVAIQLTLLAIGIGQDALFAALRRTACPYLKVEDD